MRNSLTRRTLGRVLAALVLMFGLTSIASAGPVIIDGTDANDHGSVSGGVNQDGWFYMQRALESLGPAVDPTATKTVRVLGSLSSSALSSINSAFNRSSLPGNGWSLIHDSNVSTALSNLSTSNTGIVYISTFNLTSGDLTSSELGAINANPTSIDTFVKAGGGLFAQGESGSGAWGWLTTLLPGLNVTDIGGGGSSTNLALTTEGQSAFPGLSNSDLSSGPWHNYFTGNFGGLKVLARDVSGNRAVILGGGVQGSITPTIPEPSSILATTLGLTGLLGGLGWQRRRMRSAA